MNLLSNDVAFSRLLNDVVAGTSEQKSSVLDMQGFSAVCFILLLGDVTSGCVLTAAIYENTASSTSSPTPTAVTAATFSVTAGASDQDNAMWVFDIIRPSKRYVFLDLTRTTQNAVVDGVLALQYGARTAGVVQPASLSALVTCTSGEG